MERMRYPAFSALTLTLLFAVASGCDSGDPDDNFVDCADVSGRYAFTTFTFDPQPPALPPFNILDTLDAGETELRLSTDCEYLLFYAFKGNGDSEFVEGTYVATGTEVRLSPVEEDVQKAIDLYLGTTTVFEREPGRVLVAEIPTTDTDLGDFDRAYEGTQADGTIRVELSRE